MVYSYLANFQSKMRKTALLTTWILTAFCSQANAEEARTGFYVPLSFGFHQIQQLHADTGSGSIGGAGYKVRDDFDLGTNFQTGLGYDFGDIRVELVYQLFDADLNKAYNSNPSYLFTDSAHADVTYHGAGLGAYYDFQTSSKFTPYLGGGLGLGKIAINNLKEVRTAGTVENPDTSINGIFSWHAKAGVSYAAFENIDIYGEFSYLGTDGFTYETNKYDGLNTFAVNLGARYLF